MANNMIKMTLICSNHKTQIQNGEFSQFAFGNDISFEYLSFKLIFLSLYVLCSTVYVLCVCNNIMFRVFDAASSQQLLFGAFQWFYVFLALRPIYFIRTSNFRFIHFPHSAHRNTTQKHIKAFSSYYFGSECLNTAMLNVDADPDPDLWVGIYLRANQKHWNDAESMCVWWIVTPNEMYIFIYAILLTLHKSHF